MPANLVHIPQYSAPVWLLFNRLDWHVRSGGMLQGLKWVREGGVRVDGASNLPSLQPLRVFIDSQIFAGAHGSFATANSPLFNSVIVSLGIAVDERNGFVERDPSRNNSRKGLLEWAGLICDAMETSTEGVIDSKLRGSCSKPMTYQLREPDPGELSFSCVLDVALTTDAFRRGERSKIIGPISV